MKIESCLTLAVLFLLANTVPPNAARRVARRRRPFELDYDKLFKMDKDPPKTSSRRRKRLTGSTRALGTFVNDFLPGVIDIIPGAKIGLAAFHSISSELTGCSSHGMTVDVKSC